MSFLTVVQTEYAVRMECKDCVDSVSTALSKVPGINKFKVSLEDQSVFVEGTVAPSKVTKVLRERGRAVVLRGSGESKDGLGPYMSVRSLLLTNRGSSMHPRL